MFLSEFLMWFARSGWLLLLHLSARGAFPRPLDAEEERRLTARMLEGDARAADSLIEHNLRLVAHIAKKYAQSGVDTDDLVSVGALGLIKAVRSFRPESGRLTAYASRCIENEMLMYLRANRKHRSNLLMGEALGTDRDGNEIQLSELLGTDEDIVPNEAETAIESRRAVKLMNTGALDERERRVISLRYGLADGDPRPQRDVAQALGISRSYVSRIEKRALQKLRDAMERR